MSAIPIGRADSSPFGSDSREERRWIGKPWRRVELLTNRSFFRGEQIDVTRDLTIHVGLRRAGIAFTFNVTRSSVLDYSEEVT